MFLATEAHGVRLPQSFQDPRHFHCLLSTPPLEGAAVGTWVWSCLCLGAESHLSNQCLVLVAAYSWRSVNVCWMHECRDNRLASGPLNVLLTGFGPGRERMASLFT